MLTAAFPPTPGGAESYADVLSRGLRSAGHDIRIITDGAVHGNLDNAPYVHRVAGYLSAINDPSKLNWEQMQFALLSDVADVVEPGWIPDVIFSNGLETAILGRIVALHYRAPLASTFHEHSPESDAFGDAKVEFVYSLIAPDVVIAGSSYYAERARSHVPPGQVRLVHHGVDTNQFAPSDPSYRGALGIDDDAFLLLSVGRLKARKGYETLLEAFSELSREDDALQLVIAGSSSSATVSYEHSLRDQIGRLELEARIQIRTDIALPDVAPLMNAADLIVQPSLSEGFGLALMEAMSCARPAIATRIEGFMEVLSVGSSGDGPLPVVLVEPGHPDELAQAIRELAAAPDRRAELGRRAREHILENLSQRRMVERTEEVLKALLR